MKPLRTSFVAILVLAAVAFAQAPAGAPIGPGGPGAPAGRGGPGGPGAPGGGRGNFQPVVIGPSAPAPPEVAIPHPTPSDIAAVNAEIQKLINSNTSAAAGLLKKYQSLLTLQPTRFNPAATYTQTTQRIGARHEGFVEQAKKGGIDLLFDGDSITDWWVQGDAKKAMFDKYFSQYKTANFAIAGDTTQGVLWGLKNGEGQGFQPKAVMLMIGTNNTGNNNNAGTLSAAEIAEGVGAIVLEMRNDFPQAKILLLAIFPRGDPGDAVRDKIAEINRIIAKLDDKKNVFYLDIGAKFLDAQGVFLPDAFQGDKLHPGPKGYDIWGEAVKDKIAELMR